jgi:hypothetical protein
MDKTLFDFDDDIDKLSEIEERYKVTHDPNLNKSVKFTLKEDSII